MAKNRKYSKALIAVFLTVLIWVWADLSQDEELPLSSLVTLRVAPSADPTLWLTFVNREARPQSSVVIDNVTLKGPASQVAEIERLRKKGQLDLDLALIPEDEDLTEASGTRTFNVLDFLNRSSEIRALGLTVENCEPAIVTVQTRRLMQRSVAVQCVDESGVVLDAKLEPPEVQAYVPREGVFVATVQLSSREQIRAGAAVIKKVPYVELVSGDRRDVATEVEITLAPEPVSLPERTVIATLAYCFSRNLQGKYRVEVDPQRMTELASVKVKATPEALAAYENETFHIFLYILDSDRQNPEVRDREVVFNFPEEFVRRREIEAVFHPKASFKLVPIVQEDGQASPP